MEGRGSEFDGVSVGRPATSTLGQAGHAVLTEPSGDLSEPARLHAVGPKAIRPLAGARRAAETPVGRG